MEKKQLTSFDDLPLIMTVEELAPILGVGKGTAAAASRACGSAHRSAFSSRS